MYQVPMYRLGYKTVKQTNLIMVLCFLPATWEAVLPGTKRYFCVLPCYASSLLLLKMKIARKLKKVITAVDLLQYSCDPAVHACVCVQVETEAFTVISLLYFIYSTCTQFNSFQFIIIFHHFSSR